MREPLEQRPHARVVNKDLRRALALPGVRAIITAEDVPQLGGTAEHCLTNEPLYAGEPILAVAATSEEIAADADVRLDEIGARGGDFKGAQHFSYKIQLLNSEC